MKRAQERMKFSHALSKAAPECRKNAHSVPFHNISLTCSYNVNGKLLHLHDMIMYVCVCKHHSLHKVAICTLLIVAITAPLIDGTAGN